MSNKNGLIMIFFILGNELSPMHNVDKFTIIDSYVYFNVMLFCSLHVLVVDQKVTRY